MDYLRHRWRNHHSLVRVDHVRGISRASSSVLRQVPRLLQMTQKVLTSLLLLRICGSVAAEPTHKQTTAASRRAAAKTQPPAKELFGAAPGPAPLAARAIGSYARGCLAGAVALPINGPDWQVMRLSRNRNWGHPRLLDFLERFAADAHNLDGWPGLLIGDMSQPRGGPMVNGHSSHQIGIDV